MLSKCLNRFPKVGTGSRSHWGKGGDRFAALGYNKRCAACDLFEEFRKMRFRVESADGFHCI